MWRSSARPSPVGQLQQAGHHPGGLPRRQFEQHLDRQAELDRRIREHCRATRAAVTRRKPGHVPVQLPFHRCRHVLPGNGPAVARACEAKQCSWTSSSCGSVRVSACSWGPSNRMDSRCESSTVRVLQQRLVTLLSSSLSQAFWKVPEFQTERSPALSIQFHNPEQVDGSELKHPDRHR